MRATGLAATLAVCLFAAGCQSASAPAPTAGSTRESAATAPADLQLLCASAAAERFGVPADKVLPTASTVTEGGYQVSLTLAGGSATCVVQNDGIVASVERV